MRIIVAEDDRSFRRMVAAILASWGYEVETVADGEAARDRLLAPDAPRLALLDWEMPGLDGVSLCAHLRSDARADGLYLILLTGRGAPADIAKGLEAGADDYVLKPFDSVELRARIRAGIRLLSLQDALLDQQRIEGALDMAGAVCHELNQPLQVMHGWSEMLLADLAPEDPRHLPLTKVAAAAERVGHLTKKLMGLTRYTATDHPGVASHLLDG